MRKSFDSKWKFTGTQMNKPANYDAQCDGLPHWKLQES